MTIDTHAAAEMIRNGATIRTIANTYNVSTQAVYAAIRRGTLPPITQPSNNTPPRG